MKCALTIIEGLLAESNSNLCLIDFAIERRGNKIPEYARAVGAKYAGTSMPAENLPDELLTRFERRGDIIRLGDKIQVRIKPHIGWSVYINKRPVMGLEHMVYGHITPSTASTSKAADQEEIDTVATRILDARPRRFK